MAKERDRGQMPDSMNYGAQQALAWILGKASSPSELAALVDEVFVSPSFALAPPATIAIFVGGIVFLGLLFGVVFRRLKAVP